MTLEFTTGGSELSLRYKLGQTGVKDSVDLYEDDVWKRTVSTEFLEAVREIRFRLSDGKKKITVYFPSDLDFYVSVFSIDGEITAVERTGGKVLWIGDSITQGYGPFFSGSSFVNVACRVLSYEVLNQGLGGYYYDADFIDATGFLPDKIVVSLGTNQFWLPDRKVNTQNAFEKLRRIYPTRPILITTPVYRGGLTNEKKEQFKAYLLEIEELQKTLENSSLIRGEKLLPSLAEMLLPDLTHPNALGSTVYGYTLAREIEKIGF